MQIDRDLVDALAKMNINTATDVQESVIPQIMESADSHVLAQAKTGSGKTLTFAIPLAQLIEPALEEVQAVVLVPTRELCAQVSQVFKQLNEYKKLKVVQVYGGVSIEHQIRKIADGGQIVVATPGRLIDLYDRRKISFKKVEFVVLDEADRMLDMGFMPDVEYILLDAMKLIAPRLLLFSATLMETIEDIGSRLTRGKSIITVNLSQDELTVANCQQFYYLIPDFRDKYYHFVRILRKERPDHSLIFVNTKRTGEWLVNRLQNEPTLGLRIELIMGSLTQRRREEVLHNFKAKKVNCLIATDVAARGLDIKGVSHVFNYDIPQFEENYVHRIGRTARVSNISGKTEDGIAISLVLKDQYATLNRIEGYQEKSITERDLPPRGQSGRRGGYFERKSSPSRSGNRSSSGNRSQGGRDQRSRGPRRESRPPQHPSSRDGANRSSGRAHGTDDAMAATQKQDGEKKKPERRNFLY